MLACTADGHTLLQCGSCLPGSAQHTKGKPCIMHTRAVHRSELAATLEKATVLRRVWRSDSFWLAHCTRARWL